MDESFYFNKCLQLVEQKLQWGDSRYWTSNNYKKLSELIQEQSKVLISIYTLKRLFGRLKTSYNYNPQLETKNALVIFLGYRDWNDFKHSFNEKGSGGRVTQENGAREKYFIVPSEIEPEIPPSAKGKKPTIFTRIRRRVVSAFSKDFAKVSFEGKNVNGYPLLTSLFSYDISGIEGDKVYVDFEDTLGIAYLPKDKNIITRTFFLPNYYKVKLKENDKVLAEVNVHVKSTGWEGIIFEEYEKSTFGLIRNAVSQGKMYNSPEEIYATSELAEKQRYHLQYRNIRDFEVDGDNFIFKTRVKNSLKEGGILCFDVAVKLLGEFGDLRLHFVAPNCFSFVKLQFGEIRVDGKFDDLSAFSQDLSDWRDVKLLVLNKKVTVFFEGKEIYGTAFKQSIGQIKGISYTFRGSGSVSFVGIFDKDEKVVFEDTFQ